MPHKRTQMNDAERLTVMRFVADVAARKAEPAVQRTYLIDELKDMVGAGFGFAYVADAWRPELDNHFLSSVVSTGGQGLFDKYVNEVILPHGIQSDPFCAGTVARSDRVVTVATEEVYPDLDAQRAFGPFTECASAVKLRDGIVSFVRMDDARGSIAGVGIHRLDDDRPFGTLARSIVSFAVEELAALIDRGHLSLPELAGAPVDPRIGLAPRPRQVLALVLTGAHAKRIAAELGISIWTVREHLSSLYRHFGVSGRDELMAKFVR